MMKIANINIARGQIVVNSAVIICRREDVALIHIDCVSKYPEILGHGGGDEPCIFLTANERTLYADEVDNPTEVRFVDFTGWSVFSADTGRYTVHVALMKNGE
jgi:hypothetical protein